MFSHRRFRKFCKWNVLFLAAISLAVPVAHAQQNGFIQKKLIETGWDKPDTARLRANLAQMEQSPFDGVVISAIGKDDAGKPVYMLATFSSEPWKQEWFQNCVDDLKAIHPKKLTDNFITVGSNPGNVDFFDDAGWKQIVDHCRIAAWIAEEGNLKGILFDPEAYTHPYSQFDFGTQAQRDKHTFDQYQAKARQRGKEMIAAMAAVDPNLVILTYFMDSTTAAAANSTNPQLELLTSYSNLYPSFINGWLDAAPASMTFVDGCESQGYRANSPLDYAQAANLVRNSALSLVAPENRQKYRAQVQASSGLYLDAYSNAPGSYWYIDPKGATPTQRLQDNLKSALHAADEYVWVYGEQYRWWPTPNESVKPENWEDKLPGIGDAMLGLTHPDLMIEQKLAEFEKNGKLINLLQNGDFSAPPDTTPSYWSVWQQSGSPGTLTQDASVSHQNDKSGSAKLSAVKSGFLMQAINARHSETYIVQAWNRQVGKGSSWVRVRWETAAGDWTDADSDTSFFADKSTVDANGWQRIQGVVTVPANAGKLVVLLASANQASAQDVVWFDDVRVFKVQ